MMGSVEDPARWQRGPEPWGHWHRGPFWLRNRGNGGPLRRDPSERLAGGVAAGVAAWKGINVTTLTGSAGADKFTPTGVVTVTGNAVFNFSQSVGASATPARSGSTKRPQTRTKRRR